MTAARRAAEAPYAGELRRAWLAGLALMALFGSTIGLWAAATTLSGAVIAAGQFVVESDVKKVQHPTGGIVGELLVRDGTRVEAGQVLIRLDETLTRANLQVVVKQLDEFAARRARLEAERGGLSDISVPPELSARLGEPEIAALVEGERTLFRDRRAAREGQKAQLRKRIAQLGDEIAGQRAQLAGKTREAAIIVEELEGVRELYAKNLVQITRMNALEREAAALDGQRGQILAAIAQAEGRVAETELQIIQIDEELRAEAMKELRDIQGRVAELAERRVAAEDQLKRVEIRAPVSGTVHQLAMHTVGGVITPAEPAMLIVPDNDGLSLEARIAPHDIDQLRLGQRAVVRVHASNQRTTPEVSGTLARIAADISRDPQTGEPFYTVRIVVPDGEVARLSPLKLVAGMQAEAFVETGERTPLEYFLKPLTDQVARAFRER
jgi:HlyD family secretion protein